MKWLLFPPTLMWVDRPDPFLCLKALFMMFFIPLQRLVQVKFPFEIDKTKEQLWLQLLQLWRILIMNAVLVWQKYQRF